MTKEELIDTIRIEFKGVKLHGGTGLNAAQAINHYAYDSIDEQYQLDESENWENLSLEELNSKRGALFYLDSKGYRFLLPAFMICELNERLSFALIDVFSGRTNEELAIIFSKFNYHQMKVMIICFESLQAIGRFDADEIDIIKLISVLNKILNTKLPLSDKNFTGIWCAWYENGVKQYESEYKVGKQHGKVTTWYKNGAKETEVEYQNDIINGKTFSWYRSGVIRSEGYYMDGKRFEKFYIWYENGDPQYEGNYFLIDGITCRKVSSWHRHGVKKYEREWKNEKLDGKRIEWDENGNKTKDQEYKEGVLVKDYLATTK